MFRNLITTSSSAKSANERGGMILIERPNDVSVLNVIVITRGRFYRSSFTFLVDSRRPDCQELG